MSHRAHFQLVICMAVFASSAAICADATGITACEKIKEATKRGACFEALAKRPAQTTAEDEIAVFVRQAKQRVADGFIDPDSTRFRGLIVTEDRKSKMPSRSLCGEVNAKNRYGGYVGYKTFVQTQYLDDEPRMGTPKFLGAGQFPAENNLIELIWRKDCLEAPTVWKE